MSRSERRVRVTRAQRKTEGGPRTERETGAGAATPAPGDRVDAPEQVRPVPRNAAEGSASLHRETRADVVAVEEPLEIRVNGRRLAVTMRTPTEDFSLVAGFLLSEGILSGPDQLSSIRYCRRDAGPLGMGSLSTPGGAQRLRGLPSLEVLEDLAARAEDADNTVDAVLQPWVVPPLLDQERNVLMSSACGMCGRTSIEQVHQKSLFDVAAYPAEFSEEFLLSMPRIMRERQKVFDRTGGLHAAGLFDLRTGELVAVREDVGRHNAVDKVLGWALLEGMLPLEHHALMVSGRTSFELAQKAMMAGVPVLASVSAPSSLAVELARESGMTLVGFVRENRFVVYAGEHRLTAVPAQP